MSASLSLLSVGRRNNNFGTFHFLLFTLNSESVSFDQVNFRTSNSCTFEEDMVAVKNAASNLIPSHARDRKYVLILAFSALFSLLYNSIFNPIANDPVANAALTFLFGWMAFRCAELVKGVLLKDATVRLEDKAVFITGESPLYWPPFTCVHHFYISPTLTWSCFIFFTVKFAKKFIHL